MKKLVAIASLSFVLLSSSAAFASGVIYDKARCLDPSNQDMDRCRVSVNVEGGTLNIQFRNHSNAEYNMVLQSDQITGVSAGDFEKHPGFLQAFFLGGGNQDRVRFLVDYVDEQGHPQSTTIDVDRGVSRYLESDLEQLWGRRVAPDRSAAR